MEKIYDFMKSKLGTHSKVAEFIGMTATHYGRIRLGQSSLTVRMRDYLTMKAQSLGYKIPPK